MAIVCTARKACLDHYASFHPYWQNDPLRSMPVSPTHCSLFEDFSLWILRLSSMMSITLSVLTLFLLVWPKKFSSARTDKKVGTLHILERPKEGGGPIWCWFACAGGSVFQKVWEKNDPLWPVCAHRFVKLRNCETELLYLLCFDVSLKAHPDSLIWWLAWLSGLVQLYLARILGASFFPLFLERNANKACVVDTRVLAWQSSETVHLDLLSKSCLHFKTAWSQFKHHSGLRVLNFYAHHLWSREGRRSCRYV